MKKKKSKKSSQSTQDTSTQDPGLKFLEELDQMPYTNDRVGQVSVSSWKGRPFGKKSSEEKSANQELNGNSSNNPA